MLDSHVVLLLQFLFSPWVALELNQSPRPRFFRKPGGLSLVCAVGAKGCVRQGCSAVFCFWTHNDAFGWGGLFQAQVLVCRALSNILLLPWPNLPENEQQWPVRSINHTSLISALSRDYRNLKPNAVASQRKMPLDDSKWSLHRDIPERWARLAFFLCGSWDLHLKLMSWIHLSTNHTAAKWKSQTWGLEPTYLPLEFSEHISRIYFLNAGCPFSYLKCKKIWKMFIEGPIDDTFCS